MAQKYQEQQLAAIKESRNQVIDDLSSGTVPATNPDLSGLFGNLQLNGKDAPPPPRNGNGIGENGAFSGNGAAGGFNKPPITLPRFVSTQDQPRSNGAAFPQNGSINSTRPNNYQRQYSDSVFEQQNGYNNAFVQQQPQQPQPSAGRPIKKIHNE